jgi:hypothetical protein
VAPVIKTYEASVLSVESCGDHRVATLRVQGFGTLAVEVSPGDDVKAGDVRAFEVIMGLGHLIGRDEQPADYR